MLDLIVQDAFASPAEIAAAVAAWPTEGWHVYGEHKRATVPGAALPEPIALLLYRMADLPMGLIPDLGLWGAGLHEMPPGDGLGWHTDAERHPGLGFGRAKSGMLYLSGDGDLEFREGALVRPAPGRLVVFDGAAAHRVGTVTQTRRSVTLFWYGPLSRNAGGTVRATFEENHVHKSPPDSSDTNRLQGN